MLLIIYCVAILAASLAGGIAPLVIRLTHRRMQLIVSLVAGLMLGVGTLHMLPHALAEAPDMVMPILQWVLAGFLAMFLLERFFCFHHHDAPCPDERTPGEGGTVHDDGEHQGATPCCHDVLDSGTHELTWGGAAIGLSLHTVLAGVALAASVQVESGDQHTAAWAGLGTFLVIFLHKPFDAMTISTLMTVGRWSMAARHLVNGIFALMIPLGVLLFHLGLGHVDEQHGSQVLAYALAFSAGTFLCIAMSDLLPELQFHTHDRLALSVALLLGLAAAWGIAAIEAKSHGHDHGHQHNHAAPVNNHQGHEHEGHTH